MRVISALKVNYALGPVAVSNVSVKRASDETVGPMKALVGQARRSARITHGAAARIA
jgi:hypothetical protein